MENEQIRWHVRKPYHDDDDDDDDDADADADADHADADDEILGFFEF